MKKFMPIMNDYYPETLPAFYVLGASFIYWALREFSAYLYQKNRVKDKPYSIRQLSQYVHWTVPVGLGIWRADQARPTQVRAPEWLDSVLI
jgi:hypothetical protein